MSVGSVIRQAFDLYRAHWRHFFKIAFSLFGLLLVLSFLLVLLLGWVGLIAAAFVNVAGVYWLQGALVIAIEDVRDGRADLSLRETLGRMRERINALSLASILILIAFVVAAVAIFFGLAVLIVPGLALLVLFLWLVVRWILMIPILMLERRGIISSLGRSSELVRGHWWAMLGVVVLTVLILLGVGAAVAAILYWLPDWARTVIAECVAWTVFAPFTALAWTVSYYELSASKQPEVALPAEQTSG